MYEYFQPIIFHTSHSYAIAPLLIGAGIQGLTSLIGMFGAKHKENLAKKELEELNKVPRPEYQTGEQLYKRADALATGLTPEEKAAANQNLSRLANTRYKLATERNPTVSGAAQAGINYGSIQGQLGLAAQDAQVRRNSLNQLIGTIGGQANRQTASDISYRNQTEQALGTSIQQQGINFQQGINSFGNAAMLYGLYGGQQTTTPPVWKNPGTGYIPPMKPIKKTSV